MKVVFVQYGPDIECASMMVQSCIRLGYEVIQLSDETAPEVKGVNKIIRKPFQTKPIWGPEGHMLYRMRRLLEIEPPYVMLDTDMIVVKDISDGFSPSHDASLTWREKNIVIKNDELLKMPYNGGVIFLNNNEFISSCVKDMEKMNRKFQKWYGDQLALWKVGQDYKIMELKDPKWNFSPDYLGHTTDDVRIYHFKGTRKRMMKFCWEAMEEGRDWCE